MEEIIIEKMTLKDYYNIKEVLKTELDDLWNPKILKEELENKYTKYIVAKINKNIVGFAGIKYNFSTVEIMNIVTNKNYRRKGIATIMLNNLIELSKEFNVSKIELEVNEKNISAINLYQKKGFKQVGIRKKYYNGIFDAVLMDYFL